MCHSGQPESALRAEGGGPLRKGRRGRRWRVILEQQGGIKLDQEILNLALSGHLAPTPSSKRTPSTQHFAPQ